MNIFLMNTPMENPLKLERKSSVIKDYGCYPPLGLLYLESYLSNNIECNVKVIDCIAEDLSYTNIKDMINEQKPDFVGISSFTPLMVDVVATSAIIKEASPSSKIIVGGAHATIYPKETLALPNIDYVVIGDGEETLCELIQAVSAGFKLCKIKGLGYIDDGQNIIINTNRPFNKNLDTLPFPNRRKISFDKYTCAIGTESIMTTATSSRGCPYRCTFCSGPEKTHRMRSAENILAEMKEIEAIGIKEVLFFDDLFNINKERVEKICNLFIEEKLSLKWSFRGRVQGFDDVLAKKLKLAGCERVQFGIESGNDEELKLIKKNITSDEIKMAVNICKNAGIVTTGSFMVGLPGDTRRKILERFKFAENIGLDYAQYAVLIPYPYTEIYREGLKNGFFKKDVWQEFAENPSVNFIAPILDENLTKDELYEFVDKGFRSFYFNPWFVISSILKLKSYSEFVKKFRGMLSLLRK